MNGIEAPSDLITGDRQFDVWNRSCKSESPCWGWEGEGSQCQRVPGHAGLHYVRVEGECTLQWEYEPGQDWHLEREKKS